MTMIVKRVHWLCIYLAVFSLFLIVFCSGLNKKLIKISHQKEEKIKIITMIEENKEIWMNEKHSQKMPSLQMDNKLLDTSDSLDFLQRIFLSQNMSMNKIQLLKIKTVSAVNVLPVKISAVGEFSTFYKLIDALSGNNRPILIRDFSLQMDQGGEMIVDIELWVFAVRTKF